MKASDLAGQRFGRLVAIHRSGSSRTGHSTWLCKCDCGSEVVVMACNLKRDTKSCGCLHVETKKTHGMYHSPEYKVWASMKSRCMNQKDKFFHRYGARGIGVCERWMSFENFIKDMGKRPIGMSIERIDNDGDYEPSNCRWASNLEQSLNCSTTQAIEFNGIKRSIRQWAIFLGVNDWTFRKIVKSIGGVAAVSKYVCDGV